MTDAEVLHEDMLASRVKVGALPQQPYRSSARAQQGTARAAARRSLKGQSTTSTAPSLRSRSSRTRGIPSAGRVDLALPRAIETGAISDPQVRQELAKLISMKHASDLAARDAAEKRRQGIRIIPEGSIGKLAASVVARQTSHVHTLISGADSMLSGEDSAHEGIIAEILVSVPVVSIAGGTDEIQKNIISERVLGMPKEPRFDTGPFRDVPRNVTDVEKTGGAR